MKLTKENAYKYFIDLVKPDEKYEAQVVDYEKESPIIFIENFAIDLVDNRDQLSDEHLKSQLKSWVNFINTSYRDGDDDIKYGCWLALDYFSKVPDIYNFIVDILDQEPKYVLLGMMTRG